MNDHLWRWLHQIMGAVPDLPSSDPDRYDERLTRLEREQIEIEARLRLLEIQADPWGIRGHDD